MQSHLEKRALFTGRVEKPSDFLPAMDAVLIPSYSEGLPTVAVEAQASGIPVLVSDRVSRETDFHLGLLEFLSFSAAVSTWAEHLRKLPLMPRPTAAEVDQAFQQNYFSLEGGAELYESFLRGKIRTHQIR